MSSRVAWVTGSSRGIGRVVAEHLAAIGMRVAIHGTTPTSTRAFDEANSLKEVAQAIADRHGAQVLAVHGNLSEPETVDRLLEAIRRGLGRFRASRPLDEQRYAARGTLEGYGDPMDIARAVEFLVADSTGFISGQVLRVDGGVQPWPA